MLEDPISTYTQSCIRVASLSTVDEMASTYFIALNRQFYESLPDLRLYHSAAFFLERKLTRTSGLRILAILRRGRSQGPILASAQKTSEREARGSASTRSAWPAYNSRYSGVGPGSNTELNFNAFLLNLSVFG